MILVIVGHASWDFSRLIREMDRIAGNNNEEVVMQVGHTNYKPKNAKYRGFFPNSEIEILYEKSRVVVSHAGVGTIINSVRHNKPIIVVPRRKLFGEHFDDHQVEIVDALAKEGIINVAWDVEDIESILNSSMNAPNKLETDHRMVDMLKEYLSNLSS